tara:strand:- start:50 stop:451 length:402 start_codon:yes stop_codon:yes gene_type:complete
MAKRGLYANINAKKKAGTSNPKSKSTISPEAYANMQAGFPNSKKNKAKKKTATAMYGGKMTKKKMLVGGQVKLDVAKPKGKLTAADFKELGNKGKMYGGKMKKPTKKMYGGSMKKPTKKMYGGKMHMNKKKGK